MSEYIYCVPRDLIQIAAEYLKIHGKRFGIEQITAQGLLSLLEPENQAIEVAHLMFEETFYGANGPEVGDFDIHYEHEACEKLAKAFPGKHVSLYAGISEVIK